MPRSRPQHFGVFAAATIFLIQIVKISVPEKMDPLGKHGRAGPRLVERASSRRGVSDPLGEIKVIFGGRDVEK
jgi:hypothetical protein